MEDTLESLKEALARADAVLLGAGAGLSAAAGFEYGGKVFEENFAYMKEGYGYTDMYSAGFHSFSSPEEKWAYWARMIYLERYKDGAKDLYKELLKVVEGKDYFVLTTNVDHQFQLAGFDKDRLFYTQGDYGLFQCSKPCHRKTYDNEGMVREMIEQTIDHRIPSSLVPRCPVCGREMASNLRSDDRFVEDEGWRKANGRYLDFLEKHRRGKVLYLELGVGFNTPGIIKFPFWRETYANPDAIYCCVNLGDIYLPKEIRKQSICLEMDLKDCIESLLED